MSARPARLAWWMVVIGLMLQGVVLAAGQHADAPAAEPHEAPADAAHETPDGAPADQPSLEEVVDRIYRRLSAENARTANRDAAPPASAPSRRTPAANSAQGQPAAATRPRVVLTWRTVLVWPDDLTNPETAAPVADAPVVLDWR
jgi:hypothetical protein